MIIKSNFKPAWWLRNAHLQTLWPAFAFRKIKIDLIHEPLELPDGDFLNLGWTYDKNLSKPANPHEQNTQCPLVVVLHGMTGNKNSPYAKAILRAISNANWQGVLMHFRGDGEETNRLPRTYHAGDTADLHFFMHHLKQKFPERKIALMGFSLGGNIVLKWLGETEKVNKNFITAAIAVSVPFKLEKAALRLTHGISKIYQWNLLHKLRKSTLAKMKKVPLPIDVKELKRTRNFFQYDDVITAPLYGFKDVEEYYQLASCRQYLKSISVPTLILHSLDDPLMTPDIIPNERELSEHIILEISQKGGHLGFVTGRNPLRSSYWFEKRLIEFLKTHFPS